MRTSGTFTDVYAAAKSYTNNDESETCQHSPVIRQEGATWMLESETEPTDGDLEISLEQFDMYWGESYADEKYTPTADDIADFVKAATE